MATFLASYIWGAHRRHLANTTEPSMCGGDPGLCQIALTTCLWLKVKSSPTSENIQQYKIIRGQVRRTIKTTRCQSWQTFVSSINSRTSIKRVWNMINKISGKRSPACRSKTFASGRQRFYNSRRHCRHTCGIVFRDLCKQTLFIVISLM